VPDVFVYSSLGVALVLTFAYGIGTIEISLLLALVIGALGYVLYRKGVMGAGDFFEFATISLLIPIQPTPLFSSLPQFGFPFVFSVFIATGYAAVVGMVAYYLIKARMSKDHTALKLDRARVYKGLGIFIAYLLMLAVLSYITGLRLAAVFLVLVIAGASALTIVFEKAINRQMISYVYPSRLAQEDMIATNVMSKGELEYFSSKSKHFGRLVTKKLLQDLRKVRRKVPVYTSGVPLALFAFIGILVSLLIGNILLYLIV
jgi:hypothetical protein